LSHNKVTVSQVSMMYWQLSWVWCPRWYCCDAVDIWGSSWCSVWCG